MPPSSHTAAVRHIYEQHHSWLRGWLKGKLHNASDAADVAHVTVAPDIVLSFASFTVAVRVAVSASEVKLTVVGDSVTEAAT